MTSKKKMTPTDLRVKYMQEFGAWPPTTAYVGNVKTSTVEDYVLWLEEQIMSGLEPEEIEVEVYRDIEVINI